MFPTSPSDTVEVEQIDGRLLIFTGPETNEQEFKRVCHEYGIEGRTDFEVLPLGEDGGELIVIEL